MGQRVETLQSGGRRQHVVAQVLHRVDGQVTSLLCRVPDVEDDVGDCLVVELGDRAGQLDAPRALGSCTLEGQAPRVAQIDLEETAVVLGAGGDDRLDGAGEVAEPAVLTGLAGVAVTLTARRAGGEGGLSLHVRGWFLLLR